MSNTNEIIIVEDTTIPITVDWIRKISVEGTKNKQVQALVKECLKTEDPIHCIFDKVYDLIVYEPCPDNTQSLRTIENMLREGKGNCVNYTTMLASALLLMQVPFFFRTVAYSSPYEYDHIYIVTNSGIVLDPVPGQKQDGTDTKFNRPTTAEYNREVNYKFKKDYPMSKLSILQGSSKSFKDKTGYPVGISRSSYIRRSNAGLLGCTDCGCSGCNNGKPMGTWLSDAGNFIKDVFVESIISPINVTALQISGSNLIKYTPETKIGEHYVTAQNFAGQLINDSIKVGIQSPITAINTVTGAQIDPGFHYNTKISEKFANTEKKAQYLFVNLVGSIFGVKAYDSSKPKVNTSIIPQVAVPQLPRDATAGMGTVALGVMALIALGSMDTKQNKKLK